MSRTIFEKNWKTYFCLAIANKAAPTLAEILAGTHLSPYIAKDGVELPDGQNYVDSATIEDDFDAQEVGSWGGGPVSLTMFRDDDDESDAYDLIVRGTRGFLVFSPFGVPTYGSPVHVFPVAMHEPVLLPPAANEMQKFKAGFAVTGAPAMRAVVPFTS